jgi:hypothetical protein
VIPVGAHNGNGWVDARIRDVGNGVNLGEYLKLAFATAGDVSVMPGFAHDTITITETKTIEFQTKSGVATGAGEYFGPVEIIKLR